MTIEDHVLSAIEKILLKRLAIIIKERLLFGQFLDLLNLSKGFRESTEHGSDSHFGYKILDSYQMLSISEEDLEPYWCDHPFDLFAEKK